MNNADKPIAPLRGCDVGLFRTDDSYLEQCGDTLAMGLTKREHFAAMAMQGIISNQPFLENMKEGLGGDLDALVSTASIEMADALLAALSNQEGE